MIDENHDPAESMDELMLRFVPGMELCEAFYHEIVSPALDRCFSGLVYSAAKLHQGSDVLGFDTPQSMDHDWGPAKIDLFLQEADCSDLSEEIEMVLSKELPHHFRGFPTDFEPDADGSTLGFVFVAEGPVSHRICCTTMKRFFHRCIGFNPLEPIAEADWLIVDPQKLRTITSGKVFHDGLGELSTDQDSLRWYPRDVWLYLLSCQWGRIDQEEAFIARCGDVDDELGSRVLAARMVEELMRLCFLMERQYWPFGKWFETAFSGLDCAVT